MSKYKMRISAKGLFFTADNKILLIKGKTLYNGEPFWCVPGGGVEEGESLYAAVERELTEETGYFGHVNKIVFVQDYEHSDTERNIEIFMAGTIDESKTPLTTYDHEEHKLYTEEEMKDIVYLPKGHNPFELRKNKANYKTYL